MWFVELTLFCLMMPFLILGISLLAAAFGWKPGRTFFGITLGIWGLAMIFAGVVTLTNAGYIRDRINERELWGGSWSFGILKEEPGRKSVREIPESFDSATLDTLNTLDMLDAMEADTDSDSDHETCNDEGYRVKIRRIED